jgi:hypothetical protein
MLNYGTILRIPYLSIKDMRFLLPAPIYVLHGDYFILLSISVCPRAPVMKRVTWRVLSFIKGTSPASLYCGNVTTYPLC